MKNKQNGFLKTFIILLIAFGLFAYFYRGADGMTYYEKIMGIKDKAVTEVNKKVDGAKDTMEKRDKEIEKNL